MKPDTPEVLDSILWSLQTYVVPEVQAPFAESVLKTVENLLRHVKVRFEAEAEVLHEDNADLEDLLERLLARLNSQKELSSKINRELSRVSIALETMPERRGHLVSVAELSERSDTLRSALDQLLQGLSANREKFRSNSTYIDSRQQIRDYFTRQLEREGRLIKPAFTGGRR